VINIYNDVHDEVRHRGLDIDDIQATLSHLLGGGVINREDSQREERLYDLYLRFEDIVKDWFALAGIQLVHNEDLQSIRIYAPNSETPEEFGDQATEGKSNNMSSRLNSEESAYLIALALYYEQKMREERITDIEMSVEISQEEFGIALATFTGYEPSPSKTIRLDALKTLKKLRAVTFNKDLFLDGDNPLVIRAHITGLLPKDTLRAYLADLEKPEELEENEI